ncbi:PREDICTED: ADP-ribosylation factor-binding protein GGA3-like [Cyprinodon variegatus]|uniref:ADP-ribosylation factor-binding protein GGA3-like n=1 Tax=Cyprinodon variegatus TaxID=28743 RepID=UPI0007427210|nr:PREDICTED: ADP-ribosylation factor-binding protein GGA3-like [Cyprinodon variegatus]
MASGDSPDTFQSWLNKATDPNNQEDRWDCIEGFYKHVIQETDGPQIALRLIAHKIQSPQEKEALQALTVLEACMNNCGKRFHSEAAKFRFLNELIKVLTPKYFGAWTPQKVKDRVTEVLYGWTLWLKEEPKIQEAYNMLKKQGIVQADPKLPDTLIMPPPPQRTTESVFDQEDKAKLLARLLNSGRPEDLETANRLIKSTIKEEQEKAEKAARREETLKEVESNTKQLRELLEQHTVTGVSLQPSDDVKVCSTSHREIRLSTTENTYLLCITQIFGSVTLKPQMSQSPTKQVSGSDKQQNKDSWSPLILQDSGNPPPSLKNIFVPLETIRSSQLEPVTLYNKAGIHVSLHFARDGPSGHPGVVVAVMSAVNTSALDVKDFTFQVAVPKSMLVKLQPASRTQLPPYNPLLPPPAISQVMLLANPESRKVRLRYKLSLTQGDQQLIETGEIDSFPDWATLTLQK